MKKKIIVLLILLLGIVNISVYAKSDNGFYADNKIKVEGEKESSVFAAGNEIKVKALIDGLGFLAGNEIEVAGQQDHLFIAGNQINLERNVTKELFIAGASIEIDESQIRDAFLLGGEVDLDVSSARNVYIGADTVKLAGRYTGDVNISADRIEVDDEVVILGTLTYPEKAKVKMSDTPMIGKIKKYKAYEEKHTVKKSYQNPIKDLLFAAISMIVVAIIFYAINKSVFVNIEGKDKSLLTIILTMLKGFGVLVITPFVSIMLLISTIGLPVGVILAIIYGILIYLSAIPTSYYFGKWIIKDKVDSNYSILAISIICLYILRMIPIIGGYITFISLVFGLGVYFDFILNSIKNQKNVNNKSNRCKEDVDEIKEAKVIEKKKTTKKK